RYFFFQAEDGIRDFHVTGVQTCALPICPRSAEPCGVKLTVKAPKVQKTRTPIAGSQGRTPIKTGPENPDERDPKRVGGDGTGDQIGRASCRERGESRVAGGLGREKGRTP